MTENRRVSLLYAAYWCVWVRATSSDCSEETSTAVGQSCSVRPQTHDLSCKTDYKEGLVPCSDIAHAAHFFLDNGDGAEDFVASLMAERLGDLYQLRADDILWRDHVSPASKEPLLGRVALGRLLFAVRCVRLLLSAVRGPQVLEEQDNLGGLWDNAPSDILSNTSDAPAHVSERAEHVQVLEGALASDLIRRLVGFADSCACGFRALNLQAALGHRARIRPPGPLSPSSYIVLPGPRDSSMLMESEDNRMALMTLGTGYGDCFDGYDIAYNFDRSDMIQTDAPCNWYPPRGFYLNAVRSGFKAVDTAYIYATESNIGEELMEEDGVFVSTKTMPLPFRKLGGFQHGTDQLDEQLRRLRRDVVDVLYNHHDDHNEAEWVAVEQAVTQGKARLLGASSVSAWLFHEQCVDKGVCRYHASLAQEVFAPCRLHATLLGMMEKLAKQNGTILGVSTLTSCPFEPLVAHVAKRLEIGVHLLTLRWVLEQGVPVVVQTANLAHARQNLQVFELNVPSADLRILDLIPILYDLTRDLGDFVEDVN